MSAARFAPTAAALAAVLALSSGAFAQAPPPPTASPEAGAAPAAQPKNRRPAKNNRRLTPTVARAPGSATENQVARPHGRLARAASQVSMGGLEVTSP